MERGTIAAFTTLIAEDHDDFRRLVRAQLEGKTQCSAIVEASDGLQAIEQAKELQPELILLDLALPKLNGMDAARRIRKVSPHCKIVFLSQDSSPEIVREALRLGALGYLLKSDAIELPRAIDVILQDTEDDPISFSIHTSVYISTSHTHIPVNEREGAGKEMV